MDGMDKIYVIHALCRTKTTNIKIGFGLTFMTFTCISIYNVLTTPVSISPGIEVSVIVQNGSISHQLLLKLVSTLLKIENSMQGLSCNWRMPKPILHHGKISMLLCWRIVCPKWISKVSWSTNWIAMRKVYGDGHPLVPPNGHCLFHWSANLGNSWPHPMYNLICWRPPQQSKAVGHLLSRAWQEDSVEVLCEGSDLNGKKILLAPISRRILM